MADEIFLLVSADCLVGERQLHEGRDLVCFLYCHVPSTPNSACSAETHSIYSLNEKLTSKGSTQLKTILTINACLMPELDKHMFTS